MKNLILIVFVLFSASTFSQDGQSASQTQIGESQKAPSKTAAGGCEFSRKNKKVAKDQDKQQDKKSKSKTMEIGN